MLGAFLIVGFFLGAVFINIFNSRKITGLKQEAQSAQTRYYELQDRGKKQLKEKDESINKLVAENSKIKKDISLFDDSSVNDSSVVNSLKEKNALLEKELMSLKGKNKELMVEKAVQQVEKKYPMQLYAMDGVVEENDHEKRTKLKKQKSIEKKQKAKKEKTRAVSTEKKNKLKTIAPILSEEGLDVKKQSKKLKKKSKSKKGKPKKVLALFEGGGKKKKKSKKKKKKAK